MPAAGPGRTAEAQPEAAPGASERLQALALRAEPRHAERARLTRQLAGLDASVAQRWRRHAARASASVRAAIFLPWMHVCLLFHLDTRDEALLLCALLPELDPRYAAILQALAGPEAAPPEPGAAHVPLAILARLAGDAEMRADSLLARLAGDAALRAWELVELSTGTRLGTLTGGYRLGAPIAAYLLARAAPQLRLDEPLATIAAGLPLDEQLVDAQALRQLARFAAVAGGDEEAGSYLLHLQGADTECLQRLAAATLARLGMHGALLDGRAIARFDAERQRNRTELAARIKRLGRDALLCNRVLVLTHGQWLTGSQDGTDDLLDALLPLLFDSQRLIVVLNGPARRLADLAHGYQAHRAIAALIRVGSPDTALRARIWRRHLPDFPFRVDEAALAQLVNQYPFNETQIVMALKDAASRKLIDGDDSEPGDDTQRASAASSPAPSQSRPSVASAPPTSPAASIPPARGARRRPTAGCRCPHAVSARRRPVPEPPRPAPPRRRPPRPVRLPALRPEPRPEPRAHRARPTRQTRRTRSIPTRSGCSTPAASRASAPSWRSRRRYARATASTTSCCPTRRATGCSRCCTTRATGTRWSRAGASTPSTRPAATSACCSTGPRAPARPWPPRSSPTS
nr:hypothetical protein [Burkholderia gladioli]